MKKIDLGQVISVLANLGIIVGILFLVVELQQNNELLATQARTTLLSARTAQQQLVASNTGGLIELLVKARSGDDLSTVELSQLRSYWALMLHNFSAMYKEVTDGPLELSDIPRGQWARNFQFNPDPRPQPSAPASARRGASAYSLRVPL